MINPDAGNLGAKVGFVFAGLGLPLCVVFYFFIPETRGLNFDEVSVVSTFPQVAQILIEYIDGPLIHE
jgi:hypothetical protein